MDQLINSRLRNEVVRLARRNLGYGETGGNNSGRFIRALGGRDGDEWCALFVGWLYRKSCEELKLYEPEWCYRKPGKLELGAKALTKALGRVGAIWDPSKVDRKPRPGDIVCWSRGILGWQGHVGIVSEVSGPLFRYIAGNEGRGGTVRERPGSYYKLWRFASLDKVVL